VYELLPDSRPKLLRGSIWTAKWGNMFPIFCANCGVPFGMVNEGITFAFVLCDRCESWGGVANLRKEPEEAARERLAAEHAEALRKNPNLDPWAWLRKQLENPSSPVSLIDREWQRRQRTVA
jgi:hypothetical protein